MKNPVDKQDTRPGEIARLLHLCRLGLDGTVPDHSTFSKNRHGRFRESDLLRQVFDTTVRRCMAEGLVGGDGFAVDASMIKADANRQRSVPGS
jgi:transposase